MDDPILVNWYILSCWREKKSASPILWHEDFDVTYTKVKTGDYTSGDLCIEVKSSKEDLWRTVTRDWDNFKDQGARMQEFDYPFILIRPTRDELYKKSRFAPRYNGGFIMERLEAWCRYNGVTPVFGFKDSYIEFIVKIFGETTPQELPEDHEER